MLQALNALHMWGLVHCDVKPRYFLLHPGGENLVTLIDFGLSKPFVDPTGKRYPEGRKRRFRGTAKYASANAHKGHDQSPRDDLFAWLYSTIELVDGWLPWSGETDPCLMRQRRASVSKQTLLRSLPVEFAEISRYVKSLTFNASVNYDLLVSLVSAAVRNNCQKLDLPYDWEASEGNLPRSVDYVGTIPEVEKILFVEESEGAEQCMCSVG
jgi:serine/threonine protein kinase